MLKEIRIPNLDDPLLAYETGVHLGDGCLSFSESTKTYGIYYSGNLLTDKDLFSNIIPKILFDLYGLIPYIDKTPDKTSIRVRIYSKKLFEFKKNTIILPVGSKSNMRYLPKSIINQGELSVKNLIAGFFDTDGSFMLIRKEGLLYPRVTLSNKSKVVYEVRRFLIKFGVHSNICINKQTNVHVLYINGKRNVNMFFNTIPVKNLKHLNKYNIWKDVNGPVA